MIKLLIFLLTLTSSLFAQTESPVMTTEAPSENKVFNPRESHWLTSFGFESLKYEVPFDYTGVKKKFNPSEQELWGGRLGLGGEIYLGAGFNTTTKLEGFYVGTLFSEVLNAGPDDEDSKFAFSKKTGQVYGVDASQSLGFMFDFKTKNPFLDEWAYLTVEPYIEAGLGKAWSRHRVNYDYDTGAVREGFKQTVKDDLLTTKLGGGINFTSRQGYFLFLKAMITNFDVVERKTRTYSKPNHGAWNFVKDSSKDVDMDAVTTYTIGGGYKF